MTTILKNLQVEGGRSVSKPSLTLILLAILLASTHAFSSPNPNNPNNNKNLSSSQRIRREEEQRRQSRSNENIPGKTSAIPGAQNLPINIVQTQNEWNAQATNIEKQVKEYTSQGMELLRMLKIEEANEAFDNVYKLKPYAYCWQAGVAKFYLNDYHNAAECFVHNANIYESRFGEIASEERIWRDACELKILNSVFKTKRKRKRLEKKEGSSASAESATNVKKEKSPLTVPQMREKNIDTVLGPKETRKVIRIARDLFSSSVDQDLSNEALARGKLRSICGEYDGGNKNALTSSAATVKRGLDKKMWRLNSWYYLGLHYDVLDEEDASKECMKMALRQCPSYGKSDDIVQTLPLLHMSRREWFDDDEFAEDTGDDYDDEDDGFDFSGGGIAMNNSFNNNSFTINTQNFNSNSNNNNNNVNNITHMNDNLFVSIQDSVDKMKLAELQTSLKTKGLKSSGSKSVLRNRLLRSLIEEAGLG